MSLEDTFYRYDTNGNGVLEYKEVAALFRQAMPSLTPQHLRWLLTHLRSVSAWSVLERVSAHCDVVISLHTPYVVITEHHLVCIQGSASPTATVLTQHPKEAH
jgi:hypothetical protein